MSRKALTLAVVAASLAVSGLASAATTAEFKNGPLVARKMEAHYNGAGYKKRLAASGGKVTQRILCAFEDYGAYVDGEIQCTGRLRIRAEDETANLRAKWTLTKLTSQRAKLRWTYTGNGIYEADYEIIRPRVFGLTVF